MFLRQLSHHMFALVLIFSCHRISDLTCLSVDPPFCVQSRDSFTLQFGPGLKQDRPHHVSPPLRLIRAPDEALCPVRHLLEYLSYTQPLRSSRSLFVTTTPPHGAAAWATLRQWFASVLTMAGISAPPGSTRAAVASAAVCRTMPSWNPQTGHRHGLSM